MEFFDIDIDRFIEHRANYYDRNGNFLPFGKTYCPPDYTKKIEMPKISINNRIVRNYNHTILFYLELIFMK